MAQYCRSAAVRGPVTALLTLIHNEVYFHRSFFVLLQIVDVGEEPAGPLCGSEEVAFANCQLLRVGRRGVGAFAREKVRMQCDES